ncbi:hypothetical protein NOC27_2554 [Nitrosococcus oceani AFC27]|nr:hypothetical protein NOC27_2554 [Nitrosococcus oceani AFC27]
MLVALIEQLIDLKELAILSIENKRDKHLNNIALLKAVDG